MTDSQAGKNGVEEAVLHLIALLTLCGIKRELWTENDERLYREARVFVQKYRSSFDTQ